MKILAIDTSGNAVSAAAADDNKLLSHFWLLHGRTHAEALMPCVQATLDSLFLDIKDFGAFAVISGPGSFTGLRISVATVKAFAYASKSPVAAIPTHDALAYNIAGYNDALLCPMMDARNARVYQAIYRTSSCFNAGGCGDFGFRNGAASVARLAGTLMIGVEGAVDRIKFALKQYSGIKQVIFNGDAAKLYFEYFKTALDGFPCCIATEPELYQSAAPAALLACEAAERGELIPPEALEPNYYNPGYMSK